MFNIRTSLLALVSSATSADARSGMGGFRGGFQGGMARSGGFRHTGGLNHSPRYDHRPHHVRWQRPYVYGVGTVAVAAPTYAAPAYAAVARPAAPCTCLSKEYTQDNVVVFKDRCTNEAAAAPMGQQQSEAQPGNAEQVPNSKTGSAVQDVENSGHAPGFSSLGCSNRLYRVTFLH